ncbi:ABC transporter substrate-binding protein [Trinickia mobilis]|uniref:ABC transporter substrate-binding protein n=1 Tax=Trinickia mobilis TaxID=2816356 RepID=UPI001A8F828F|nr:ABC transporter substrate-binding protein [Trinickia mobilis]
MKTIPADRTKEIAKPLGCGDNDGIGRRHFLGALAGLGLAAVGIGEAGAAPSEELVVANWGGPAAEAFIKVWGEAVRQQTGVKLVIDGSGPTPGKIRAMVEARKVAWDVCDATVGPALMLGNANLLEPIDYAIVGNKVKPEYQYPWAVCNYIFSYVLAFNKTQLKGHQPTSWKDFWNFKDFPGKRALRGSCVGQLECALLADGVPPSKIYPIDLPRALEKIKEIREHAIFWKTGAQSEDLFRQGEVSMGNMWHNRTNVLRLESNGQIDWIWDGGVVAPAVWVVPKGNPAGKQKAMEFIRLALEPQSQAELFKIIGMGPSNPAAAALIPDNLKPFDPSQAKNLARQIPINEAWYRDHLAEAEAKYLDIISS